QRLPPVVLAVVDRLADVGVSLGEGFPRLEDLERGECGAATPEDRRGAEERRGPLAPGRGAPGGQGTERGVDGALRLRGSCVAGAVGGRGAASASGSGSVRAAGGAISASSAWPSAKR